MRYTPINSWLKKSSSRPKLLLILALASGFSTACISQRFIEVPKDHQQAFLFGVEQAQKGRHALSAKAAWQYFKNTDEEDPRYDRVLRLLARNAEALGLNYAASAWYLQIAQGRRDVELIPEALNGLRTIIESGIFDEDALVKRYLAVEEFSTMGAELDSFIHYHQGLHNLRQGQERWASRRLKQIHPRSFYRFKAQYIMAVRQVALGQLAKAQRSFEKLAKRIDQQSDQELYSDLWRDSKTSLARLAMQKSDYQSALSLFEEVRERVPDDPSLLLEIAWAHFKKGSPRRALGFLLALDAPIYQALIAPERYILEAMTYRALCQFGPARQAAVRLSTRYKQALSDLYDGVIPEQSKALRAAAGQRGELRSLSKFIDSLAHEKAIIKETSAVFGPQFTQALTKLYAQGKASALARRERALRNEISILTEELLSAEEGVRLITHELGVALLRGRKPPQGRGPIPPLGALAQPEQVVYQFNGEFWTDELDELVVAAEDRCID